MDVIIKNLLNNMPSAIIAILTSILTAYWASRWSMNKFFKEKWWERKEKVYEDIINALYDLLQYCEIEKEIDQKYTDEKMKELSEQHNNAYWKIKKITAIGSFTYSKKVEEILKKLNNRERLNWDDSTPWDIYQQDYDAYKEALEAVINAAKEDLKAKMPNSFFQR